MRIFLFSDKEIQQQEKQRERRRGENERKIFNDVIRQVRNRIPAEIHIVYRRAHHKFERRKRKVARDYQRRKKRDKRQQKYRPAYCHTRDIIDFFLGVHACFHYKILPYAFFILLIC